MMHDEWSAPPRGWGKLNTDAIMKAGGIVGLGAILHDAQGRVMKAMCKRETHLYDEVLAEAHAVRAGLDIVSAGAFQYLIVESKCAALVAAINDTGVPGPLLRVLRPILCDIWSRVEDFAEVRFACVPASCNECAHRVAKLASSVDDYYSWSGEEPLYIPRR